jgi:hypothetical protein
MSLLQKCKVSEINDLVIELFARFGRLREVARLLREAPEPSKSKLKSVARVARKFGQFRVAQQIYEEIGDDANLFALFVISKSTHNLAVLAGRSKLSPVIARFYDSIIPDPNGIYEALHDIPLPKPRPLLDPISCEIYPGDPSDVPPLCDSTYTEVNEFAVLVQTPPEEVRDDGVPGQESYKNEYSGPVQTFPSGTENEMSHSQCFSDRSESGDLSSSQNRERDRDPNVIPSERTELEMCFDDDEGDKEEKPKVGPLMMSFDDSKLKGRGGRRRTVGVNRRAPFSMSVVSMGKEVGDLPGSDDKEEKSDDGQGGYASTLFMDGIK